MLQTIGHGPIRELRLDRPPANALSPDLISALRQAVESAPGDGARALVISGSPRMFSGGLDVPYLIQLDRPAIAATWRDFYAMMRVLATSPIPVAAAVTGHAPAGGAVISLFCDHRVMSEGDFKIGLNEVPVGIPLPPVIFKTLRRVVGSRQAERLCVAGLLISGDEALRVGLVDELAAPERVVERAVEWCRSILALPPRAMAVTRALARADLVALFEEEMGAEVEGVLEDWFSPETQRTLRELMERMAKRKG
ncbi:MAG TPA: enoyl-CoA hydratase/isomerase family protein [Thermoanaerobaculia bacterium]|nr:enoyl-CoA hydratase/isomerase family protein [Thermoanaerobaculia bacterium]